MARTRGPLVVVPYYLSQGYNYSLSTEVAPPVVVPYYLSQGYNLVVTLGSAIASCSSLLSLSRV